MTVAEARITPAEGVQFIGHLANRDRAAAIAQVMRLLDGGASTLDVIARLLGPAQLEVGRLWETGEWSVAQEHIATGITDDVLRAVSFRQPERVPARGTVAVACVEGEYHAMPARMLTEILRAQGFPVTFLGASLPADSLSSFLEETRPVALALSCSLSSHLVNAGTGVDVAHGHGIPVIAGGAAFGGDGGRARALGADAWSATAAGAVATLDRWAVSPPRVLNAPATLAGDHIAITSLRTELIAQAVALVVAGGTGAPGGDTRHLSRLRIEIGDVLDHLAAAVKVGDGSILAELLVRRGPAGPVGESAAFSAARRVVPDSLTVAHRLLDEAATALPAVVTAA